MQLKIKLRLKVSVCHILKTRHKRKKSLMVLSVYFETARQPIRCWMASIYKEEWGFRKSLELGVQESYIEILPFDRVE